MQRLQNLRVGGYHKWFIKKLVIDVDLSELLL